jgi:hypothetical protein
VNGGVSKGTVTHHDCHSAGGTAIFPEPVPRVPPSRPREKKSRRTPTTALKGQEGARDDREH